ncbi:MAG: transglycosylase domain-containing protein [Persicimonas sp.]
MVRWSLLVAILGGTIGVAYWELTTSTVQARVFADIAKEARYRVAEGPSDAIRFPEQGPFDQRQGYSELPEISERLEARGFRITDQARLSDKSLEIFDRGYFLPYWPEARAGLELFDAGGHPMHESLYPYHVYDSFEEVPRLIVDTLLHIENRALLDDEKPRFNPALEWKRFLRALGEVGWAELGGQVDPDGASTLATQIEKYRHSPGGMTQSYDDKIRQMVSASLRAYQKGERTRHAQENVVLSYVNSVPLSAVPGFGEVLGIGDGLHAWYGADVERVSQLLHDASAAAGDPDHAERPEAAEQARAFRQVASLFVAQRRPSYFLADLEGREQLAELTDFYLRDLARNGLISAGFRDLALAAHTEPRDEIGGQRSEPFWTRKLSHSLRVDLLDATGADSLYALDHYDLGVETTVNQDVQHAVEATLAQLGDPAFVAENGLDEFRLLDKGDPSEVIYSFTLYERTPEANLLRVEADTYDQPFNLNDGMKLNLGSTAKLRTLTSYLNVVAELHDELAGLTADELDTLDPHSSDRLTHWAIDQMRDLAAEDEQNTTSSLQALLEAAMQRRYSADPRERFFTGGGIHRFSNFNYKYDRAAPTVQLAIEQSINLVFVRMMRDIVRFHLFRQDGVDAQILRDRDDPRRRRYLERFADFEGTVFLRDFYRRYEDDDAEQSLVRFLKNRTWTPKKFVAALRTIRPEADIYTVHSLIEQELGRPFEREHVEEWYARYAPDKIDLNDQGYLSGVHPLELWLLRYRRGEAEQAGLAEVTDASTDVRQEIYRWLFKTSRKHAQDQRIRIMMEQDAFGPVHEEWKRLGYPFDELVPSYASSIGSSSDRPAALAELVGIILNGGYRLPRVRFESLHFAAGTPYETRFERAPQPPERVMPREVARTLRRTLADVVEDGTAHRLSEAPILVDGEPIVAGGKTGTGDNRHNRTNRHGRTVTSIAQNRTATFVFYLGERFFGTVTAYVPGQQADDYHFTSGLAVSVLGLLGPALEPLWHRGPDEPGPVAIDATPNSFLFE